MQCAPAMGLLLKNRGRQSFPVGWHFSRCGFGRCVVILEIAENKRKGKHHCPKPLDPHYINFKLPCFHHRNTSFCVLNVASALSASRPVFTFASESWHVAPTCWCWLWWHAPPTCCCQVRASQLLRCCVAARSMRLEPWHRPPLSLRAVPCR